MPTASNRPRRTPRLGRAPGRPLCTLAAKVRCDALYRQLRALVQTDEGALAFMRLYARVAPEAAAAAMRDWFSWFCRTQSPTAEERKRAADLVKAVCRG
jgi:hypothetical protein